MCVALKWLYAFMKRHISNNVKGLTLDNEKCITHPFSSVGEERLRPRVGI